MHTARSADPQNDQNSARIIKFEGKDIVRINVTLGLYARCG